MPIEKEGSRMRHIPITALFRLGALIKWGIPLDGDQSLEKAAKVRRHVLGVLLSLHCKRHLFSRDHYSKGEINLKQKYTDT